MGELDLSQEVKITTYASEGAHSLVFMAQRNKTIFTVTPEGDIKLGEGVTLTEAAQAFWKEVDRIRPGKVLNLKGDT